LGTPTLDGKQNFADVVVRSVRGLIVAGYGGHAGYAFAIAHELVKRGVELDIILPRGYEYLARKFIGLGKIHYITLPRRPLEQFYKGVHRWFNAFLESLGLLRVKYDFVFASGSNFSVSPSLLLRLFKRTPVFTLEDVNRFTKPSKAVKALHVIGAKVMLHWEEQKSMYPDGLVIGPVYEPAIYEPRDEGYILVTLGTLGSKEVFDAV